MSRRKAATASATSTIDTFLSESPEPKPKRARAPRAPKQPLLVIEEKPCFCHAIKEMQHRFVQKFRTVRHEAYPNLSIPKVELLARLEALATSLRRACLTGDVIVECIDGKTRAHSFILTFRTCLDLKKIAGPVKVVNLPAKLLDVECYLRYLCTAEISWSKVQQEGLMSLAAEYGPPDLVQLLRDGTVEINDKAEEVEKRPVRCQDDEAGVNGEQEDFESKSSLFHVLTTLGQSVLNECMLPEEPSAIFGEADNNDMELTIMEKSLFIEADNEEPGQTSQEDLILEDVEKRPPACEVVDAQPSTSEDNEDIYAVISQSRPSANSYKSRSRSVSRTIVEMSVMSEDMIRPEELPSRASDMIYKPMTNDLPPTELDYFMDDLYHEMPQDEIEYNYDYPEPEPCYSNPVDNHVEEEIAPLESCNENERDNDNVVSIHSDVATRESHNEEEDNIALIRSAIMVETEEHDDDAHLGEDKAEQVILQVSSPVANPPPTFKTPTTKRPAHLNAELLLSMKLLKKTNVTPKPNFGSMSEEELNRFLAEYGLRPLGKRRAIEKLNEIYEITHPPANPATPKKSDVYAHMMNSRPQPKEMKRANEKARLKRNQKVFETRNVESTTASTEASTDQTASTTTSDLAKERKGQKTADDVTEIFLNWLRHPAQRSIYNQLLGLNPIQFDDLLLQFGPTMQSERIAKSTFLRVLDHLHITYSDRKVNGHY